MSLAYRTFCNWRQCTADVAADGTATIWIGPVGCPCDILPSWDRDYLQQMHKPQVPVKAKGRHGSRVQRAKHRKRKVVRFPEGGYLIDWVARLQAEWAREDEAARAEGRDPAAERAAAIAALPTYSLEEFIAALESDV